MVEVLARNLERPSDSRQLFPESFLQSDAWGEIQRRYGRKTARVAVGEQNVLCIQNDLRFGLSYWYAPRPHISDLSKFLDSTEALIKNSLFFKLEPINEVQSLKYKGQSKFSLREAPNLQPKETIFVNLLKTEEELLAAMHPKTRYNIRIAARHGVVIEPREERKAVEEFHVLLRKTAERDSFSLHPKRYYECLTSANSPEFANEIFFVIHGGAPIAAAMVNFYKGTATYLHGASDYRFRNVMAPYMLHWQIMNEAKRRGCASYDFGGIDEARWPGVTRFKKGFGGGMYVFPGALDVATHPVKYFFYRVGRMAAGLV